MLLNYLKKKAVLFSMMGFGVSSAIAQQNQTIPGSFSVVGEDDQTKKKHFMFSLSKMLTWKNSD